MKVIAALVLVTGVLCISYAMTTPGTQAWFALVGGLCLGVFPHLID